MNPSVPIGAILFLVCLVLLLVSPLAIALAPWGERRAKLASLILLAVWVGSLGFVIFTLDSAFAITSSWLVCAVLIILIFVMLVPVVIRHHSRIGLGMSTLLAMGIVILHFVDLSSDKPFKRFYGSVLDGMTRVEILAALHREFPERGRFPVPVERSDETNKLVFILDPLQQAFNSEGVILTLRDGRVVGKQYMTD
jgi:hypothetical protein